MKRWMKWTVAVVAVLAIAGFVAKAVKARKLQAIVPVAAPMALDLVGTDVLTVRTQELTRTLSISGGLKAATSAVVKAKVAAEIKSLNVREGDAVKAGQVIGQLDTTEFEWRVTQAEQTAVSDRTQLDIA